MLYRHIKTGKRYHWIAAAVDCTNSRDGTAVVIYCPDDDGHAIYVRDRAEFEAKFAPLGVEPMAPGRSADHG
jgi:hypothetical protein